MLTHARERLPNSSFHLQDMRTFSLSEHFDLILCLYDTINHLTSFDQWQQCFSRMASHLAPGGLCIIDMNTPSDSEGSHSSLRPSGPSLLMIR